LPLYSSDVSQTGSNLAELAFSTFRGVKWDNMVTNFDIGDTFTHGLDDSSAFVSTDHGKCPFRIFSGKGIGICMANLQCQAYPCESSSISGYIPQSRES